MTLVSPRRPPTRPRPARSRRGTVLGASVLGACVLAAAALGGVLTYRSVLPVVDPAGLHTGGVTYSVVHAEEVAGLSDADLSGMSHGIQGLVGDDQALVRVTLDVVAGDAAALYDPAVLVVDDGSGGPPLTAVGGSLAPGGLGAGGRIEGALGFVVRRAGQHLTLRAPGGATADLLTVDLAPAGAGHHDHASTGPDTATPDGSADGGANQDPFSLDPVPGDPGAALGGTDSPPGS